jgi:hypothetical protein
LPTNWLPVISPQLPPGDTKAGNKRLDQPGSWVYIPADDKHQIAAQGKAHLIEIEVR